VLATLACAYLVIVLLSATLISRNLTASEQVISGAAVSLILVFAFQPIKQFFDRATNKIFYKDRYNMDEFYARINDALMLNTDLRGILERTASEIATTLKSEQVFFFISTKNEHYVSAGTSGHNQLPNDDVVKIAELRGTDYRTVAASILNSDDPLRQIMVRHKIEIMIPLVRADSIIGYLCLGYQLSSDGYASRDIKALNMITDELIIAVQNALAVQEVRELNLTLKQRIADATKELRMSNNRLRNLDKAKDEFVSVAAHELRTPMTVMRGFINLLQRKQLGEVNSQQLEILEKMNTNAKNLIDLVNNMLDLSKLEANRLVIQKSDNFLNDLVGEAMEKISLLYEAKGLGLVYDKASVRINTDTEKFERVLVNLLSNAYKFTPAGGSVTISSTIDEETRMVTMCVTDTGMGIPADSIDKLFKKFSQVDNYLQKTSGGTGLGLSICKQMVEKLGGKIWVESTPDVGSRFYFTTPMSDDLIKE
jgi:signal transduction histidine kinase